MASVSCKTAELAPSERKWWYFILADAVLFSGGLVIILLTRLTIRTFGRKRRLQPTESKEPKKNGLKETDKFISSNTGEEEGINVRLKEKAGELVSAQTSKGRVLVVVSFIFSLLYCALYIIESSYPVEHCLQTDEQILWIFEICFNFFFMGHFLLRFLAANDKLLFWFELHSIVDMLTVPNVFIALVTGRNWIGLRFLRALQLMNLSEILLFLGVLTTSNSIEMVKSIGNILGVWFTSAGFVHLLENTGDPWNFNPPEKINYFEALYYLIVTMSTVGYGDYYTRTYLGRVFTMLFICVGLGIFANFIPILLSFLSAHTIYNRSFKPSEGRKHVIVCGHITKDSVESFLRDFLHKDREDVNIHVVFLYPSLPNPDLEAILKRHFVHVSYFNGTVFSFHDCKRVKLRLADAVLILCNKNCEDPNVEDAANIMRVVAIKNHSPNIRVIIQLLQYENKPHLLNIPTWSSKGGDDVVCISELKLGFVAQSCLSPGFSTMLANIFAMRSAEILNLKGPDAAWKIPYLKGSAYELYTETLSSSFIGMTFQQVSETCFEKLKLLCIAIETRKPGGEKSISINPSEKSVRIQAGTRGFFIADSSSEVRRAYFYCSSCHKDVHNLNLIKECTCPARMSVFMAACTTGGFTTGNIDTPNAKTALVIAPAEENNKTAKHWRSGLKKAVKGLPCAEEEKSLKFDSTGMFYWCEPVDFEDVILKRDTLKKSIITNHVVVCVFGEENDPPLGLRNLVMPLRASNLHPNDLKRIILLGNRNYLIGEWHQINTFQDVQVMVGSPFSRVDLRAINANLADMVVILSPTTAHAFSESALGDRQSILATLNLKAMNFDDGIGMIQHQVNPLAFQGISTPPHSPLGMQRRGSAYGCNVPTITELVNDMNVQFLDQDDEDDDDAELYITQPFACGTAFVVSVLDSLMSATYFNVDVLNMVRELVTGGVNPTLEAQIAEGGGVKGGSATAETEKARNRCKISQISLFDGPLAEFGENGVYGEMFLYALRTYSMICLGVYRFRDHNKTTAGIPSSKRFVITAPQFDFILSPTDMVFVLAQFDSIPPKSVKTRDQGV